MKILIFEGHGDDTFACTGRGIDADFDNCANGKPIRMRVRAADGAMIVTGQYAAGPNAGWMIGVAPADGPNHLEEYHIPDWPMSIVRGDAPYSPRLLVTAPDDVSVVVLPTSVG